MVKRPDEVCNTCFASVSLLVRGPTVGPSWLAGGGRPLVLPSGHAVPCPHHRMR